MAEKQNSKERAEVAASDEALESMGYKQELKRALSVKDMIVYGLIFMVPIAPFGIYGGVFDGSGGMPALVYLIGMVTMIFTALTYGVLSREFPMAGSVYGYVTHGVAKGAGFMAGWAILMDYLLIPTMLYVVAAGAMNGMVPGIPVWAWSVIFIVINTFVNFLGIEATKIVNIVALVLELIVLAVFVVVGVWWVAFSPDSHGFTLQPFYNPSTFNISLVMGAVSLGVLSFLGFDGISTLSEEAEDAQKGPSCAMVVSLLVVGVLFMLQTYVAGLISPDGKVFADDPDNAFYLVSQVAGGKGLYVMSALATAISWGFFNALVAQTALTRILFAMGRDRMLPKALCAVHPKTKTPYIAVLFVGVVSLILVLIFDQLGTEAIGKLVNFGALTSFAVLHLTVIWHFFIKKKTGDWLNHLVLPIIGFVIIAYVWISLDPASKTLGLSWLAVGLVYYLILHFVLKRDTQLNM